MTELDFHADDYGLSAHSDGDILALCREGVIDSISVMANMEHFAAAAQEFHAAAATFPHPVLVSVHLNFMEGKCCAPPGNVPDLVDKDGFFTVSWGKLLLWNYNPIKRARIRRQLAAETGAQIQRAIDCGMTGESALRLDSHQHPHMIPLVFDAVLDAVDARGNTPLFIRNSEDPLGQYFKHLGLYASYAPANVVKCIVLNWYARRVRRLLRKRGIPAGKLCGVFFSGHMDAARVRRVLPGFSRMATKSGAPLEILFHPGTMLPNELGAEFTKPGFNRFHLDAGRQEEHRAIRALYHAPAT